MSGRATLLHIRIEVPLIYRNRTYMYIYTCTYMVERSV